MPVLRPNVPPPPHYYADNVLRLLAAVLGQYNDILLDAERNYLERVFALSIDGQRLYARLLTRKGPLLRIDRLCYREVEDLDSALYELQAAALLDLNPCAPADQILKLLTRSELDVAFPADTERRGQRKDRQVDVIAARYPDPYIRQRLAVPHPVCALLALEKLQIMLILFFGDAHTDLTTFVLEDLGMWRFEIYPLDPAQRQFSARADFDDYLDLLARRRQLRRLEATWLPAGALELLAALGQPRPRRLLERARSGLVNQLGRCAERAGAFDVALAAYSTSTRPPGRERRIRLLTQLNDRAGAAQLLDDIEAAPQSAGERYFAHRFRAGRIRGRHKPDERILRLPQPPTRSVEAAALAALTRNGGCGRHLENLLPRGMLGLALWDVVFAPVEAAFVNPYQDAPLDLYWSDFRRSREELINARLATLRQPGEVARTICATAHNKRGVSNALVAWHTLDVALLHAAVESVPGHDWVGMFDYMLDDLEQTRTGFPDLALFYGPGSFRFVEVKGPGDQMRREQHLWFEFFAKAQIPATVLRVVW